MKGLLDIDKRHNKDNIKAMKTLRAELSAEGRLDILERVMAYRGGK